MQAFRNNAAPSETGWANAVELGKIEGKTPVSLNSNYYEHPI